VAAASAFHDDDPRDVRRLRRHAAHAALLRGQGTAVPDPRGQKRLFTRRDRARLKLILRGKRFGFSLEEIRQLLDLYDRGDQQQTQLKRTYEVAQKRLGRHGAPARRAERGDRRPARSDEMGREDARLDRTRRKRPPSNPGNAEGDIHMPRYTAPTKDMQFVLHDVLKISTADIPGYADLDRDFTAAILDRGRQDARRCWRR
jgi:DNA-binding transcriptional MerR regulator